KLVTGIDLSPHIAPHTLRLAPDGLIYITCENSAKVVAIDPKTNSVAGVIDLPARKLIGKIATPEPLAGIAVSGNGKTVVAVSDVNPVLFMIDTVQGKVARTAPLEGVPKAAQIARYSPDGKLLVVSSLNSDMVSLIDVASGKQAAIGVGSQPMDFAFRDDEIFVGCQGDGSMHIIDVPNRQHKQSFKAGAGCESVGSF